MTLIFDQYRLHGVGGNEKGCPKNFSDAHRHITAATNSKQSSTTTPDKAITTWFRQASKTSNIEPRHRRRVSGLGLGLESRIWKIIHFDCPASKPKPNEIGIRTLWQGSKFGDLTEDQLLGIQARATSAFHSSTQVPIQTLNLKS